jgi:hypothetical protein
MASARFTRLAVALVAAAGAAATLSACTYVERERPPQQTLVVPAPQPSATVVQPVPQPAPTVTVRPSY